MSKLANKSIVVIGGTSGLGFSAAKAFIAAGARVVIVGRDPDKANSARAALGKSALALAGDASDPQTAVAAVNLAAENFGGFDGLYHVSGASGRSKGDGPLHELSDEGWEHTIRVNLTALCYSNRAAVRKFLELGAAGSVLNMSSVLGYSPSPHFFATHAYASAKAAVIGLTKSAAAYYAPRNIRLNVLAPALVATPMSQRAQENQAIMGFMRTKQPLDGGRIGQPADLDAAAVYFLADDSKFVTGQVLAVDGGWSVSEGQIHVSQEQEAGARAPKGKSLWYKLGKLWAKSTGEKKG